jgi:sugar phosphate isomerase/epimerase
VSGHEGSYRFQGKEGAGDGGAYRLRFRQRQGIGHEEIIKLLPQARHIQIRQAAPKRLQTPFDKGTIDIKRVVVDVLAAGYDDLICVEYMNTPGWHRMEAVNAIHESARLRDELRAARDALTKEAKP